jgi:hypothetical protein
MSCYPTYVAQNALDECPMGVAPVVHMKIDLMHYIYKVGVSQC